MEQPPKFVRWAVLIGIVVLLNVFSFISVSYAFPEPEYKTFCGDRSISQKVINTEESCIGNGGVWENDQFARPDSEITGYCDLYKECSALYNDAQTDYAQTAFLILLGIAAAALIAGMFLKGSSIVAAGLSYGGVVLLITSSMRWLGDLDRLVQIIAVGVALILVLVIAYRKFKD
ncbi:hypothetical protein COB87_002430 [Candidatus Wolfebacteria bacterium]|nr:hypothetical protein [Candidatus Wolfebacteria bacterium]